MPGPSDPPIFIGRPALWSNPFEGRPWIGRARAVILYRAWLADELGPTVLRAAHFSPEEVVALGRWRARLMRRLSEPHGRELRCSCRSGDPHCHLPALAQAAGQQHHEALAA